MTISVRLYVTLRIQRNKESNVNCSLLSPYTSIALYASILFRIRHVYGHLRNLLFVISCNGIVQRAYFDILKLSLKQYTCARGIWGITIEFVGFTPQSLVLISVVLGWIFIYRNWSILWFVNELSCKTMTLTKNVLRNYYFYYLLAFCLAEAESNLCPTNSKWCRGF